VREAKRRITDVYFLVDRLSRAVYDVRIVDAKTGAEIKVSEARVDFGIRQAFAEQEDNSIGACLARGEAVFV
jgi:RecB family exonuclease